MGGSSRTWAVATRRSAEMYRRMIDETMVQLSDEELHKRTGENQNSVAVILRHLGGNLQSRWTDFLTTDGEKETRQRDQEFDDWPGDRGSLLAYFDQGWERLMQALVEAETIDPETQIRIRGELQTLADAILRSLTHVSYHVGQIMIVARAVHTDQWKWLTIEPGTSDQFNQATWGTAESRGVAGPKREKP